MPQTSPEFVVRFRWKAGKMNGKEDFENAIASLCKIAIMKNTYQRIGDGK